MISYIIIYRSGMFIKKIKIINKNMERMELYQWTLDFSFFNNNKYFVVSNDLSLTVDTTVNIKSFESRSNYYYFNLNIFYLIIHFNFWKIKKILSYNSYNELTQCLLQITKNVIYQYYKSPS